MVATHISRQKKDKKKKETQMSLPIKSEGKVGRKRLGRTHKKGHPTKLEVGSMSLLLLLLLLGWLVGWRPGWDGRQLNGERRSS